MNNLGIRFSEVGRRVEPVAPVEEAVGICRGLAEENPAAYLPDLATSLSCVGWICEESGLDPNRGLPASEEAVDLFAALADQLPAAFKRRRDAASATLANLLEAAGRAEDAARARRRFDQPL